MTDLLTIAEARIAEKQVQEIEKVKQRLEAESRCPINSHAVYCGDGYCYMFSPKIDMREVEK